MRAWLRDGAMTLGVMVLVLGAWWCLYELMTGELALWLRGWL